MNSSVHLWKSLIESSLTAVESKASSAKLLALGFLREFKTFRSHDGFHKQNRHLLSEGRCTIDLFELGAVSEYELYSRRSVDDLCHWDGFRPVIRVQLLQLQVRQVLLVDSRCEEREERVNVVRGIMPR